jgi:hypothetical protein
MANTNKPKPKLGPNGSPVKSTASTYPRFLPQARPRTTSVKAGQPNWLFPLAPFDTPRMLLTHTPFPRNAVGRKKIRIERIADERNRQVRTAYQNPIRVGWFGWFPRLDSRLAVGRTTPFDSSRWSSEAFQAALFF